MTDNQYAGICRIINIATKAGLDPAFGNTNDPIFKKLGKEITKYNISIDSLERAEYINIHTIKSNEQHKAFKKMMKIANASNIQVENNNNNQYINKIKLTKEEIESAEYYNFWFKRYLYMENI